MEAWGGKVAIVTGASSGIGAAVCKSLCKWDITVLGLARRLDKLIELQCDILGIDPHAKFYPIQCDLTKEDEIASAFKEVREKFTGVDILINNAGVMSNKSILEDSCEADIDKIIKTNLLAVVSCTKKAYKSMVDRGASGYIINISSVAGHCVSNFNMGKPILNVYPSSKHAITALNDVFRHELNFNKQNKIRVSNISPGSVRTDVLKAAGLAIEYPIDFPALLPQDIADAILYILSTPPRVQIQDIIIRPTGDFY